MTPFKRPTENRARHIVNVLLDGFEGGSRVALRRAFWGHKPGTKGRITKRHDASPVNRYTGTLKLRGSPLASVRDEDEGDLFDTLPKPKSSFYPSAGGPSSV